MRDSPRNWVRSSHLLALGVICHCPDFDTGSLDTLAHLFHYGRKPNSSFMHASFVEIQVQSGLPAFRCPVSGIPVWTEDGFNEEAPQSPYIRFFADWAGQTWVVPPAALEGEEAVRQTALIATLQVVDEEEGSELSQDELMKQIATNLPPSAVVFEIFDPHPDGMGGEICYVVFDFTGSTNGKQAAVKLEPIDSIAFD